MEYDEAHLVRRLEALSNLLRTAFAAACAERLLPTFPSGLLRSALDALWDDVQRGRARPGPELVLWLDQVSRMPDLDEDAAAAVAYALRSRLLDSVKDASLSARRAYDAVDHQVWVGLGIDPPAEVLAHPLVQAELARQDRDLQILGAAQANSEDVAAALRRLRELSIREALRNLE